MSPRQTDLRTRLRELEATVSGLTQELVEANERIRQLEAAGEGAPAEARDDEPGVEATDGGEAKKQMGDDGEGDDESATDLDGIIVA